MLQASPSTLLLLSALLQTWTHAHPTSVWHVSIDEAPAPPPDEGPPFSADAIRDKSKLPYQVAGIVAAYFLCVSLATALILLGRRLRRKAQTSDQSLGMEMVKPAARVNQAALGIGPSPVSPRGDQYRSWANSAGKHKSKQSQISVSTVDEKVVEADKAKNMDEMERLYAAVMAHDQQSFPQARSETYQPQPQVQSHGPPELQHLRDVTNINETCSQPTVPTPIDENFQSTTTRSPSGGRNTKASPLSIFSNGHSRAGSATSTRTRPSRISIRGQPISNPMGSPDLRESVAYSDEAPLSPRIYSPGPPPPTPGQKSAAAQAREADKRGYQRGNTPAALSLRSTTATNSTGSLPFRQVYADSMKSAPPTKTTFLDKRESILHPAPKTGVPFTPYSPYMPYTPVTPITPGRLVTRDEMKRNKKKHGLKVLSENDMVASEEDMWGKVK